MFACLCSIVNLFMVVFSIRNQAGEGDEGPTRNAPFPLGFQL